MQRASAEGLSPLNNDLPQLTCRLEGNVGELCGTWQHFTVHPKLSEPPDDEVGVLRAKVEDEAVVGSGSREVGRFPRMGEDTTRKDGFDDATQRGKGVQRQFYCLFVSPISSTAPFFP